MDTNNRAGTQTSIIAMKRSKELFSNTRLKGQGECEGKTNSKVALQIKIII